MPIRLIVADDHPVVLAGLRALFSRERDLSVAACCATSDEAIDAVRTVKPDVLVLDLRLPPHGGLEVLRTIGRERFPCRTMVLTAAASAFEVASVLRLGALGIVLKESPAAALFECLREVHRGRRWTDPELQAASTSSNGEACGDAVPAAATLTSREVEIVRKLASGLRNREIATDLAISEGTVKIHLHRIYEKLGLNGRLELVLYAQERRLV